VVGVAVVDRWQCAGQAKDRAVSSFIERGRAGHRRKGDARARYAEGRRRERQQRGTAAGTMREKFVQLPTATGERTPTRDSSVCVRDMKGVRHETNAQGRWSAQQHHQRRGGWQKAPTMVHHQASEHIVTLALPVLQRRWGIRTAFPAGTKPATPLGRQETDTSGRVSAFRVQRVQEKRNEVVARAPRRE